MSVTKENSGSELDIKPQSSTPEPVKKPDQKSPDFFIREIITGGKDSLEGILNDDSLSNEYTMMSKEQYLNNEKFMEKAKKAGLTEDKFDDFYKAIRQKYDVLSSVNQDAYKMTKAPSFTDALPKQYQEAIKATNVSKTNKKTSLRDSDVLKYLTVKEIAQEVGVKKKDGSFDNTVDDNAFSGKDLRVAREIDENNKFSQKQSDFGLFFLEEFDSSEHQNIQDDRVTVWNKGVFKDSFMDANKVDENAINPWLRKAPQVVAATLGILGSPLSGGASLVAAVPFLKDAVVGGAELYQAAFGDEDTEWLAELKNSSSKWDFDQTRTMKENPFSYGSVVSNVADIVGQLGGMAAVSKAGYKGVTALATKLGKDGTKAGKLAAAHLGKTSMALSMGADFPDVARSHGIPEEDIDKLTLAFFAGNYALASITNKVFSPIEGKIQKHAAKGVLKKMIDVLPKNGEKPITNEMASTFVKNATKAISKRYKGITTALQEGGVKGKAIAAVIGAGTEGIEESLETSWEALVKASYNNTYGKGKKENQGRFMDFDRNAFMREVGVSFAYGALAGGLMGTSVGKKALGQTPSDLSKATDWALDNELSSFMENNLEGIINGDKKYSYAKDEEGNYLLKDPKSVNPLEQMSQHDFDYNLAKEQWKFVKSFTDYKISELRRENGLPSEKDFNKILKEQLDPAVASEVGKIKEDVSSRIKKDMGYTLELDKLAEEKSAATASSSPMIEGKIKTLQEEKQANEQELKDILAGKHAHKYTQNAIYDNVFVGRPPMSFEKFTDKNQKFQEVKEETQKKYEELTQVVEKNSELIMNSDSVAETLKIAKEAEELNDAAFDKVKDILTSEEGAKAASEEVSKEIEFNLRNTLASQGQSSEQIEEAVSDVMGILENEVFAPSKTIKEFQKNFNTAKNHIEDFDLSEFYGERTKALMMQAVSEESLVDGDQFNENYNGKRVKRHAKWNESIALGFMLDTGESLETPLNQSMAAGDSASLKEASNRYQKQIDYVESLKNMYIASWGLGVADGDFKLPKFHGKDVDEIIEFWNKVGRSSSIGTSMQESLEASMKSSLDRVIEEIAKYKKQADTSYKEKVESEKDPIGEFEKIDSEAIDKEVTFAGDQILPEFNSYVDEEELSEPLNNATRLVSEIKESENYLSKRKLYKEFHYEMGRILQVINNDENLSKKVVEEFKKSGLLEREPMSLFLKYEHLDLNKVDALIAETISEGSKSSPTWEQQRAVYDVFALASSNMSGKSKDSLYTKMHNYRKSFVRAESDPADRYSEKEYRNFMFLVGSGGSGKTTYVGANVNKMLLKYLDEIGGGTKVIATGHTSGKEEDIKEGFLDFGVSLDQTEGSGHLDVDAIIELLKSKDARLKDVGVINFDEATFISGDKLLELEEAMVSYNSTRKIPLQFIAIGDPNQAGAYMERGTNIMKYNLSASTPLLPKTTYISTSQRFAYSSMAAVSKAFNDNINLGVYMLSQELVIESTYGKGDSGEPAGVEFISKDQAKKDNAIYEMLNAEGSFYYVTDRTAGDQEYDRILKKFPELKNKVKSISQVQGDEADFVFFDYSNTAIDKSNKTKEKLFRTITNMVLGRARKKVAMFLTNDDRKWTSIQADQKTVENALPESKYAEIKEYTINTLNEIADHKKEDTAKEEVEDQLTYEEKVEEVLTSLKSEDIAEEDLSRIATFVQELQEKSSESYSDAEKEIVSLFNEKEIELRSPENEAVKVTQEYYNVNETKESDEHFEDEVYVSKVHFPEISVKGNVVVKAEVDLVQGSRKRQGQVEKNISLYDQSEEYQQYGSKDQFIDYLKALEKGQKISPSDFAAYVEFKTNTPGITRPIYTSPYDPSIENGLKEDNWTFRPFEVFKRKEGQKYMIGFKKGQGVVVLNQKGKSVEGKIFERILKRYSNSLGVVKSSVLFSKLTKEDYQALSILIDRYVNTIISKEEMVSSYESSVDFDQTHQALYEGEMSNISYEVEAILGFSLTEENVSAVSNILEQKKQKDLDPENQAPHIFNDPIEEVIKSEDLYEQSKEEGESYSSWSDRFATHLEAAKNHKRVSLSDNPVTSFADLFEAGSVTYFDGKPEVARKVAELYLHGKEIPNDIRPENFDQEGNRLKQLAENLLIKDASEAEVINNVEDLYKDFKTSSSPAIEQVKDFLKQERALIEKSKVEAKEAAEQEAELAEKKAQSLIKSASNTPVTEGLELPKAVSSLLHKFDYNVFKQFAWTMKEGKVIVRRKPENMPATSVLKDGEPDLTDLFKALFDRNVKNNVNDKPVFIKGRGHKNDVKVNDLREQASKQGIVVSDKFFSIKSENSKLAKTLRERLGDGFIFQPGYPFTIAASSDKVMGDFLHELYNESEFTEATLNKITIIPLKNKGLDLKLFTEHAQFLFDENNGDVSSKALLSLLNYHKNKRKEPDTGYTRWDEGRDFSGPRAYLSYTLGAILKQNKNIEGSIREDLVDLINLLEDSMVEGSKNKQVSKKDAYIVPSFLQLVDKIKNNDPDLYQEIEKDFNNTAINGIFTSIVRNQGGKGKTTEAIKNREIITADAKNSNPDFLSTQGINGFESSNLLQPDERFDRILKERLDKANVEETTTPENAGLNTVAELNLENQLRLAELFKIKRTGSLNENEKAEEISLRNALRKEANDKNVLEKFAGYVNKIKNC